MSQPRNNNSMDSQVNNNNILDELNLSDSVVLENKKNIYGNIRILYEN